jgi:hypothetical protein
VPADGRDLNPLLQDPGMIIHPPMLYMGYVGFSVAFAFAVAALLGGKLDAEWARWTRPWTVVAWMFLTIGIALGSWWAYYELGWGGWWFWDPVENASFMPWLVGTALIHSLAVTEKRGAFKSWTVLLAIIAFSLSLLGTFLVRSGVLSSVHAFATDPARGLFILGFLVVVVGASLTLYAWRAPTVGLGSRFGLLSRETLLLSNNVMLVAAMAAVLLGTLYPLLLDALDMGKISVGPPYFDTVFMPLMAPVVFLMGVGPLARWKETSLPDLATRLRWALGVTVVAALASGWLAGKHHARVHARPGHGLVGVRLGGHRPVGTCAPARRQRRSGARPAAAALGDGHDGRPPGRGRVHHRRHHGQGLRGRARRAHGGRRQHHAGALHLHAQGPARTQRTQLPGHPGDGGGHARRQEGHRHVPREAGLPRAAQPDDRGGHRHRFHCATCTSRWASRWKAAPGSCACTTSPSSTGSGAAASSWPWAACWPPATAATARAWPRPVPPTRRCGWRAIPRAPPLPDPVATSRA